MFPLRGNIFSSKTSTGVISNISPFPALEEGICRDQPFAVAVSEAGNVAILQGGEEGSATNSLPEFPQPCCSSSLIPVLQPGMGSVALRPIPNPAAEPRKGCRAQRVENQLHISLAMGPDLAHLGQLKPGNIIKTKLHRLYLLFVDCNTHK